VGKKKRREEGSEEKRKRTAGDANEDGGYRGKANTRGDRIKVGGRGERREG